MRTMKYLILALFVGVMVCLAGCVTSYEDPADNESHYSWAEGEIFEIQDQDQYDWAIQQRNVLVMFVRSESCDLDPYLLPAADVAEDKLPWLWLAKAGYDAAPEVFENADVTEAPTLKFFSYGVEMKELELTGHDVTEEKIAANGQVLIDRYESDVLHPHTYEELMDMIENSSTPVMVKFGAFWCPPCVYMIPRLELASIQYGDELLDENGEYVRDEKLITIVEVETMEIQGMGDKFGFEYIPAFAFFDEDGARQDGGDMIGARPYDQLEDEINLFLDSLE